MATNYPTSLDTTTELPASGGVGAQLDDFPHSVLHGNINDAVRAIETELGTNPSGAVATVKARIEAIEANDWVTTARIVDAAVTEAKLGTPSTGSLDGGNVLYARMGSIVHVWTTNFTTGATLPAGFRPATTVAAAASIDDVTDAYVGGYVSITTAGVITCGRASPGEAGLFSVSFSTV